MSVILTSTTSTPEEVQAALEHFGEVESVESVVEGETVPATAPPDPAADPTPEPAAAAPVTEPEPAVDDDLEVTAEERAGISQKIWKQFNKATRQRFEEKTARAVAESQLADRDKRIADLEAQIKAGNAPKPAEPEVKAPPAVEPPKPEPKPRPKPDDFEDGVYGEAFQDALHEWREQQREAKETARVAELRQEIEELKAKVAPERIQAETQAELDRQERMAQFNGRVEEAKKLYSDYDKVSNNADVSVSFPLQQAIADDPETDVQVFYYLGSHPDEAKRIFDLTTLEYDAKGNVTTPPHLMIQRNRIAAREHARIVALIQKPPDAAAPPAVAAEPPQAAAPAIPAPKPKPVVSKAPPPIKPGGSVSAPLTGKDPYTEKMSPAEYNAWRDQQRALRN